jgi:hypothetical protein
LTTPSSLFALRFRCTVHPCAAQPKKQWVRAAEDSGRGNKPRKAQWPIARPFDACFLCHPSPPLWCHRPAPPVPVASPLLCFVRRREAAAAVWLLPAVTDATAAAEAAGREKERAGKGRRKRKRRVRGNKLTRCISLLSIGPHSPFLPPFHCQRRRPESIWLCFSSERQPHPWRD